MSDPRANGDPGAAADVDALLDAAVEALGGERRPGQVAMARAVDEALAEGRHALIQAGTGTGKSLAYLVPAVAAAARDGSRIVVSTATLALQRQIVAKDLPIVLDALEPILDERPVAALLKGRANYLCRHRLAGGFPPPDDPVDAEPLVAAPTSTLGRDIARLTEWATRTETGDRDDLEPGVGARAWAQVSVGGRECLGSACPLVSECFAEKALEEARAASIVVTNHAMLAIEATSHDVIGPRDALIVDEAHELVSRITSGSTHELSVRRVENAARAARRLKIDTSALDEAAARLALALDASRIGRLARGVPEPLSGALADVATAARAAVAGVDAKREGDPSAAKLAVAALGEVVDVIGEATADDGKSVVWLAAADGDYGANVVARLLTAPLDVASLIGARLVAGDGAVFTSATLAIGGTFEPMAAQLGIDDPVTLDAGSPFDHEKQGILYVASHLDRPGSGGIAKDALDELAALIEAAGGRTLGLFSSHRAAQDATEAMRERLDVPILYQRDDQVPALLARFRADPRACLFGSTTLWQGVDLPGATCQLVVIDRIPFPRPDDPIVEARSESVDRAGGNGFMAVSATQAALLLAQGAGRLIRTLEDRGVVAILDSRLATARYGGFLARSLPPLWATTDRVAVLEALRRLDAAS